MEFYPLYTSLPDKRVLYGFISQVGGGAPTIAVVKNTIGAFTTAYLSTGGYQIIFDQGNAWPFNSQWLMFIGLATIPGTANCPEVYIGPAGGAQNPGVLPVSTRNLPGAGFADGQLTNCPIAILLFGRF